ncbi:hypothetical protein [Burkholderia sp. LMG 32019]|uniref:hypothetical protein n=1 Tax=Burkholderia sp. LMG 32019 TaxID=3158173 RepID=UPI003C2F83AF
MDFSFFRLVPLIKTIDPASRSSGTPPGLRHCAANERRAARRRLVPPSGIAPAFTCAHPATIVAVAAVAAFYASGIQSHACQVLTVPQQLFIHHEKFPEFSVCLTKHDRDAWGKDEARSLPRRAQESHDLAFLH